MIVLVCLGSNYTTGSAASIESITRRTLYRRLHSMLQLLISLIPTLASALAPLLATHFPTKRDPILGQICYIDNLLVLTEYCPALAEDVLGLVIERALNIDVEIQGESDDWEDIDEVDLTSKTIPQNNRRSVAEAVDRPTAEDEDDSSEEDDGGMRMNFGEADSESDDEGGMLDDGDEESGGITGIAGDDEADKARERRKKNGGVMSLEAMKKARENSVKLDAILKVVFDHLAAAHAPPTPASTPYIFHTNSNTPHAGDIAVSSFTFTVPESLTGSTETTPTPETAPSASIIARRLTLFRTLLDIFDRTLLRTFKTRHTQFLLFYLCSLDPSSSDHFIGVLLGRALFETEAPAVTRVAAAGYVASFISRAKFVDRAMTQKVVRLLCEYLETQMNANSAANSRSNSSRNLNGISNGTSNSSNNGQDHLPVFYAVAQAIFYIFCFRWRDLLDDGDEDGIELEPGRRWMMGLETLKRAVSSNFNPLKVRCASLFILIHARV
jgi:RNA polymerase I-specific transcription initiation factor RRN3